MRISTFAIFSLLLTGFSAQDAETGLIWSKILGPVILCAMALPLLYIFMTMLFKINKPSSSTPSKKLNEERGQKLNEKLRDMEGERLSAEQRKIIADNVGLYHWLPEKLINPWEERILVFLKEFHFSDMAIGPVTEEMRLLVAAEACLLIIQRP